jgi:hypothetical protein
MWFVAQVRDNRLDEGAREAGSTAHDLCDFASIQGVEGQSRHVRSDAREGDACLGTLCLCDAPGSG